MIMDMDERPTIASIPSYTFTGDSTFVDEGNGNWHLLINNTGTLSFSKLGNAKNIDIFLLGAGEKGGNSSYRTDVSNGYSGKGGNGGFYLQEDNVRLKSKSAYECTIGSNALFDSFNSADGIPSGVGGDATSNYLYKRPAPYKPVVRGTGANNGSGGVYPFGDSKYDKVGGGGGSGCSGGLQSDNYTPWRYGGRGAANGANGGIPNGVGSSSSRPGGGGGGAGAGGYNKGGGVIASGGKGGPALIIIRNHRK